MNGNANNKLLSICLRSPLPLLTVRTQCMVVSTNKLFPRFLFEHRSRSVFKMIAIRLYFIYSKKIIFYPVVHFFKIHLYYNLLPLQTQNVYAYLLICSPFSHYFTHKENTLIFHKFISIYL